MTKSQFSVNGRSYAPPARPVVVVCVDGCGDEYLSTSIAHGCMPTIAQMARTGYRGMVRAVIPTFTNVNNSAIVTGMPPSVTGISGNFFLDPETGKEVMMNSAAYLRCPTILAAAARAGRKVAMVTAKEKLRDILSKDMTGIAFSSEKANQAQLATHGISDVESVVGLKMPEIYSGDASLFVLRAGAALIHKGMADFLYLSLTDYMQHKYTPEAPQSLEFYKGIDNAVAAMLELGATVALTADHGMNAKNNADGKPNVIYLLSLLTERFGSGIKVICPITDPYVVHHGALGSMVMVHLQDPSHADEIGKWILNLEGITEVYDRATAAVKLELPADRIGDLVVLAGRDVVVGKTPADHDLAQLGGSLRSHGGRYEEMVPMILSEPLQGSYIGKAAGDPRNFDIFDFACNGATA